MSTGRKPRRPVNFRTTETAVEQLDQRAADEQLFTADGDPNRSELIRIMLAYAYQHMPPGHSVEWPPTGESLTCMIGITNARFTTTPERSTTAPGW